LVIEVAAAAGASAALKRLVNSCDATLCSSAVNSAIVGGDGEQRAAIH
jgi:hypothetical protein